MVLTRDGNSYIKEFLNVLWMLSGVMFQGGGLEWSSEADRALARLLGQGDESGDTKTGAPLQCWDDVCCAGTLG